MPRYRTAVETRYRDAVHAAAAFLAATVAGLALMVPFDFRCIGDTGSLQTTLLIFNVPRASAAGALVAVVTAVIVGMFGLRAAWATAFGSSLVVLIDHLVVHAPVGGSLASANFIDSIFAGILLGAAGAAALKRGETAAAGAKLTVPAIGYLLGGIASTLLGNVVENAVGQSDSNSLLDRAFVDMPPVWLIAATTCAIAASLLLSRKRAIAHHTTAVDLPFGPIFAAALLITALAGTSEWLARRAEGLGDVAIAVVVTVGAALIAALLLPRRDGTLVLLMVATAATATTITANPPPPWTLPLGLAAVAAGLYAGRRRPAPVHAGLAVSALAVYAVFTTAVAQHSSVIAILGGLALCAVSGYCFGSALPSIAAGTVLALAVQFVPSALAALRDRRIGIPWNSELWSCGADRPATYVPGWTAVAIALGCVLGILLLRRKRPVPGR
ncbi:hypothetical protein [Nocardia yamanashiensis]|uniref:hypothetical protein n=1 Tax=Nocardia yamanashiensis TaxID=209247 RepID=UPI0008354FAA|nr:hypothetical protein [Nocardia yamanashiensis]